MIDLQQFCDTAADFGAGKMDKPWTRGEYTYVTNGHIALRMPRVESVEDNPKAPDCAKTFVDFKADAPMRPLKNPLPPAPEPQEEPCGICHGEGIGYHDCPDCACTCEECEGSGKVTPNIKQTVWIGKRLFNAKYIRMIAALPGLVVNPKWQGGELDHGENRTALQF